jgi:NADH-quinone oxidoreductase subunit E
VKAGETTEDLEFTLECVNCVGACALGPVVVADGDYYGKMKLDRLPKMLDEVREGEDA